MICAMADTAPSPTAPDVPEVRVTTHGAVAEDTVELARSRLSALARQEPTPLVSVAVRITHAADPANSDPWRVEATVDLGGQVVRAHATAAHSNEAVDRATERLGRRLDRSRERRQDLERRAGRSRSGPGARTAGGLHRHKALVSAPMSVDDAALECELLDHDFFLFLDADAGAPAVVVQPDGAPEVIRDAPVLDLRDARARRAATGARFLLFTDEESGAGAVVYRRHDGGDGLITLEH